MYNVDYCKKKQGKAALTNKLKSIPVQIKTNWAGGKTETRTE